MSVQRWIFVGCVLLVIAIAAIAQFASGRDNQQQQQPSGSGQGAAPQGAKPPGGGPPAMPPPLVAVAVAQEKDVHYPQTFVGTVMPKRIADVGSAVDGRVVEFPVNEGDRVEKGDTLTQLLTGQLDIQLAGAKAEVERLRYAHEELKNTWPDEVKQADARHKSRKAALDYANAKLTRARSLHQRAAITDDQLQDAQSQADQAQAAFAEAAAALAIVQGPRQHAIRQAEHAVEVQQEEANAIQDQINKHTIKAPFNGYVTKEHTEMGQWVAKAGLVAQVAELDEVDVAIMVLEDYLPNIRLQMPARVVIRALPEEKRQFMGQVAVVVPQADTASRTFPVKVRVANTVEADGQMLIRAGMQARVTLEIGRATQAVVVPKDAVVLGGATPVVYVVDPLPTGAAAGAAAAAPGMAPPGTVRPVSVELGLEDNNWIVVVGDVRPGQQVVTEGNERLRPGMPVRVAPGAEGR
jgi:RND family efflux transporter MFP subunit